VRAIIVERERGAGWVASLIAPQGAR
jgi:hypothetical protein